MDRRKFLKIAAATAAATLVASTTGAIWRVSSNWLDQAAGAGFLYLSDEESEILHAIGRTFFPPPQYPQPTEINLSQRYDEYLGSVTEESRRGLKLLLHAISDLARADNFSTKHISDIPREDLLNSLRGWETSSIIERRSIFQGLKLLVAMIYCAHPIMMKKMNITFTCT